jgi:hypothetical protein
LQQGTYFLQADADISAWASAMTAKLATTNPYSVAAKLLVQHHPEFSGVSK